MCPGGRSNAGGRHYSAILSVENIVGAEASSQTRVQIRIGVVECHVIVIERIRGVCVATTDVKVGRCDPAITKGPIDGDTISHHAVQRIMLTSGRSVRT